jgi:diadenosine tetraphosphate (Ap4A) HIT family hydrolase
MTAAGHADDCELCRLDQVLFEADEAYVRFDNNALARGHVLIVPRRHVASFFDMTAAEKLCAIDLLDRAKAHIDAEFRPDGYNIGVNVGRAAGQARMHVHVHLIPRYTGDVADPRGGIRCVLPRRAAAAH